MYKDNLIWWCCAFLLINSSSEQKFRNNKKLHGNSTEQYEPDKNSKIINDSIARSIYGKCDDIICIQLCPFDDCTDRKEDCVNETDKYIFPEVHSDDLENKSKRMESLFEFIYYPCSDNYFRMDFLINKSIFFTNDFMYFLELDLSIESTYYSLSIIDHDKLEVIFCQETWEKIIEKENNEKIIRKYEERLQKIFNIIFLSCYTISILCLLTIFLAFSILPELRGIHSFMLRRYSSSLFIHYTFFIIDHLINMMTQMIYSICIISAIIKYFCALTSYFWLSAIIFDMWWTFRELRLLHKNVKQQRRKKLIYSIFAWGSPFILTIICIIMNFAPLPNTFIRPGFGNMLNFTYNCWFSGSTALYFYLHGPVSICIVINIFLSISTALKVKHYEKDAVRHLKGLESRCYNNNKQWFNMYLKLIIVALILLGIRWFTFPIIEFFQNIIGLFIFLSILFLTETIQNFCMLIIFVCKKRIIRLLLTRLGCQERHSIFPNLDMQVQELQAPLRQE